MGLSRAASDYPHRAAADETGAAATGGEKRDFGKIMSESAAAAQANEDDDDDSDDLF